MSKSLPPTPLRQEDYLAIEAAVMETSRGRWFLAEYARRNRNADTDSLLAAIDKLEKTIVEDRVPSTLMHQVKIDLTDMASAIERTKREIAQIRHEDDTGTERFERASIELDAIVSQTETATSEILGAAEKIQEFGWTLREQGAKESVCDELDMEATNIYMACSFQDLTGQRIQKIVNVMRYVESRINAMVDIWDIDTESVEIDQTEAKSHDMRPDVHLLNGPALEGEGINQDDVNEILGSEDDDANQDDVDALFDVVSENADAQDVDDIFAHAEAADTDSSSSPEPASQPDVEGETDSFVDANEAIDAMDFDAVPHEDVSAELASESEAFADANEAIEAMDFDSVSEEDAPEEAEPESEVDADAFADAGEAIEAMDFDSVSPQEATSVETEVVADVFAGSVEAAEAMNFDSVSEEEGSVEAGPEPAADVFAEVDEAARPLNSDPVDEQEAFSTESDEGEVSAIEDDLAIENAFPETSDGVDAADETVNVVSEQEADAMDELEGVSAQEEPLPEEEAEPVSSSDDAIVSASNSGIEFVEVDDFVWSDDPVLSDEEEPIQENAAEDVMHVAASASDPVGPGDVSKEELSALADVFASGNNALSDEGMAEIIDDISHPQKLTSVVEKEDDADIFQSENASSGVSDFAFSSSSMTGQSEDQTDFGVTERAMDLSERVAEFS